MQDPASSEKCVKPDTLLSAFLPITVLQHVRCEVALRVAGSSNP